MAVQNELGYCMPVAEVCRLRDRYAPEALVHTDTVQALGKIDLHPFMIGVWILLRFRRIKLGDLKVSVRCT